MKERPFHWAYQGLYASLAAQFISFTFFDYGFAYFFVPLIYLIMTGVAVFLGPLRKIDRPLFPAVSFIFMLLPMITGLQPLAALVFYTITQFGTTLMFLLAPDKAPAEEVAPDAAEPEPEPQEVKPSEPYEFLQQVADLCTQFGVEADETTLTRFVNYCRQYDINLNGGPVTVDLYVRAFYNRVPRDVQKMLLKLTRDALQSFPSSASTPEADT